MIMHDSEGAFHNYSYLYPMNTILTILHVSAGSVGCIHHGKELSLAHLQSIMFPDDIQETCPTFLHKTNTRKA